jgi:hypothetical protein
MSQYLDENQLSVYDNNINFIQTQELLSTDSYDETLIKNVIDKRFKNDDLIILMKCALQIAIIGSGQKSYGSIMHKEKEIEIEKFFTLHGIKFKSNEHSKYTPDELSARRIVRFFRYQIHKFIIKNNKPSYLFKKYAPKTSNSMKYIPYCFPGCEHFIIEQNHVEFLFETYKNLDERHNTKFREKIERVFNARGIMVPVDLL